MKIQEQLSKHPKPVAILLGLITVALLGFLDYLIVPNYSLNIFFFIPVALGTWFAGKNVGITLSVASAIAWFTAAVVGHPDLLLSPVVYWNAASEFVLFLAIVSILPTLKTQLELERALARTDYLTGAANKRCFFETAAAEIQRAGRYKHPFTIAYLDIDNFKFINDRYGHNTGDTLLQSITKAMKAKTRSVDTIARLGGDEFAVLLPETQPEPAQIVARRLHKSLVEIAQKNEWPVTFSMGVVTFLDPPGSPDQMLKRADVLLYAAKNSGKNMIKHEVFSSITVARE